ncbi:MAG: asparagine synthase (glutamine-hydrolyzing) [Nitrospiraceae bacterium]
MCGISGLAYSDPRRPVDRAMLRRMMDTLIHRGPDGQGVHIEPGVGLGIRRLSIIDLETGDQPISNEDGTVTVVCNGEIYNFRELCRALRDAGHRFRTGSDVEVIVHLYEEHGLRCLDYLRGMFGFALWDARRRRLLLARDRLGIKPLLYAETSDGLWFGSELKSILMSGRIERHRDVHALNELFTLGFVRAPNTLLKEIRQLLPGHYLLYEDGIASVHEYWDVRFPAAADDSPPRSGAEWAEAIRAKLEETVRLHLRSDVPVGAWLSGGLDSSSIVSLMSRCLNRSIQTFSLAFEHPEYDEVRGGAILKDFPGYALSNRQTILRDKDFSLLRKAVWHCEDSVTSGLSIARMLLSEVAAQDVKVVLTGEGADEVFGGYPWFRTDKLIRPLSGLPLALRRFIAKLPPVRKQWPRAARLLAAPAAMNLSRYKCIIDPPYAEFRDQLFSNDVLHELGHSRRLDETLSLPDAFDTWHPFAQLQYVEMKTRLPNVITRYLDTTSMAYSLEARVPFLDHEFVELCSQVPPSLKMRGMQEKHILRRAMRGILPDDLVNRPKRGLVAPPVHWLREPPDFALDLLSEARIREAGYFNPAHVMRMLEQHRTGRADFGRPLISVLGVHLWDELFMRSSQFALTTDVSTRQTLFPREAVGRRSLTARSKSLPHRTLRMEP